MSTWKMLPITDDLKELNWNHKCTREIPEPVPFLSPHGPQKGGLWVFPVIKITLDLQVHMSPASTVFRPWWTCVKCRTACEDCGRICYAFVFLCVCGRQNPEDSPNWAPWLTTPLHWMVYEVWDLPCLSVIEIWIKMKSKCCKMSF